MVILTPTTGIFTLGHNDKNGWGILHNLLNHINIQHDPYVYNDHLSCVSNVYFSVVR